MTFQILPARNGQPTLFDGTTYLEDVLDPVEGASVFVKPEQVKDARVVVLFGAGLGYRVRRIRELGVPRLVVFEPSPEVLTIAQGHDSDAFDGVDVFTDFTPLLDALLKASFAGHTSVVLVPPSYRRAFPDAHQKLMATMKEVEEHKVLKKNTLVERYGLILETALRNLPRLSELPLFTELGRPLEGSPAFLISAGPSLDKNAHLLKEASEKGAIFTVNTASPAVIASGAQIDVLACIESLDVTDSLARGAAASRLLALDLSANSANFNVEADAACVFMPASDPFHTLARMLGTTTMSYGASVATAAFALARHWGADPIVLLGQDLAYSGGRVYATHTGREGMTATPLQGGRVIRIEYAEEMLDKFRKSGVKEPSKHRPGITLPAWGGGEVASTHDMMLFLRWFETAAHQLAGSRRLINATEGGASIEGFEELPLAEVLAGLPARSDGLEAAVEAARPLRADRVRKARQDVARGAREIARAAKHCLKARPGRPRIKAERQLLDARRRSMFVEVHCAPELIKLRDAGDIPEPERRRQTALALQRSAKRVAQLA